MSGFTRRQVEEALSLGWTQDQVMDLHTILRQIFEGPGIKQVFRWGLVDLDGIIWYRGVGGEEQMRRATNANVHVTSIYYTDGSGTTFDKPAGIGVFANHGTTQEFVAENIGPGTNNRAELVAIWRALRHQPHVNQPMLIYSDSEYAIGSCTKDWVPQKNADLIRDIREDLSLRAPGAILFQHVPGHKNIEGNEIADKLANIGRKLVTKVSFYTADARTG